MAEVKDGGEKSGRFIGSFHAMAAGNKLQKPGLARKPALYPERPVPAQRNRHPGGGADTPPTSC